MKLDWRIWRRQGGKLLVTSVAFLALMIVFSFTPIIWILQGSPNESYPELIFFGLGIPLASILFVAAAIRFFLKSRAKSNS